MSAERDHLFLSYAWEDEAFLEWLALKLTSEGYLVWCDRLKLFGGESLPVDIDKAIKERTFRLLALLSHNSIAKPNPTKERALALNLGKERGEDFLIPLNVDGLRPAEIDWSLSDLTYIAFHRDWAKGFAQLLKKLESVGAPRPLADGRAVVADWFAARDAVNPEPERLWTNLLELRRIPTSLVRARLGSPPAAELADAWPHYVENASVAWCFEGPGEAGEPDVLDLRGVAWEEPYEESDLRLGDVATNLLRQHLRRHCLAKGLCLSPEGDYLYFPPGLLPNDRISFASHDGSRTWVQVTGERRFRTAKEDREVTRYHLAPEFRVYLWKFERPVVQLRVRLFLTDAAGKPLPSKKAARRRKKIAKNWWNHQWLMRTLAIATWIADGASEIDLTRSSGGRITLAGLPLQLEAPVGIDESVFALNAETEEDDELLDDEETPGADAAETTNA